MQGVRDAVTESKEQGDHLAKALFQELGIGRLQPPPRFRPRARAHTDAHTHTHLPASQRGRGEPQA